jgi:hypothetical protein
MQRRMVCFDAFFCLLEIPLICTQLTKEEEASAGSEDMEVRREDQEKINKFSSLHQKETNLEEELRAKIVSAAPSCCCPAFWV